MAETLGRGIAQQGWTLVTGGYGGVMEAASAGAASAKGKAVGVLCKKFGSTGNRFLSQKIVEPDLQARLQKLIDIGDAYVAMPGSTGTLTELATVWELMNKGFVPLRPLFCFRFWEPVVSMFTEDSARDSRFETTGLPERKGEIVSLAESPESILDALRRHWES